MDEILLKSQFGILFDLCLDKEETTVTSMCRLGWQLGGNGWQWRSRLFAWEEQLWSDFYTIAANVVLQVDFYDEWEWTLNPADTSYSVGGAYHLLTRVYPRETSSHNDLSWNKLEPSNVFTFAWRFINDRLPTNNLIFLCVHIYVMIHCYAQLVVVLLRISMHHLFLNCPCFVRFGVTSFPGWGSHVFFMIMQFRWHQNFVGLSWFFAKILRHVYKQFG
jgi:hypothetical protein